MLPLLPLRDIVVFPNMVAPLFVGRKQSVNALNAVMTGDKKIFLLSQKSSEIDNPTEKNLYLDGEAVINWIDKFDTDEWADIDVGFYGVKLNDKFWDGLSVRFGTDINSKQKNESKRKNYISVKHGMSSPDFFSSWENSWVGGDGHYKWNTSFPTGPRIKKFNAKSRDEKLLMIRLLQSMQHLLDNKKASPQLMKNPYVQEWLQGRINEANSLNWNLSNGSIPNTKIFSYILSIYTSIYEREKYRMFRCGPERAGIDFEGNRFIDEDISVSLSSELIDQNNVGLTTLLLPEVDLGLDENDFLSIMSYEGFQLK